MKNIIIISIAVLSMLILGGCSDVSVEEQSELPKLCTADWNPVCGVEGKTYGNKCAAGDMEIAYEGECDKGHSCTTEEKASEFCTMDYTPVCGVDGVTYGNGCSACSAKVDSWTLGEC